MAQIKGLILLVAENLDAVDKMARNAELERLLAAGIDADELRDLAHAWPESPQGRKLAGILERLELSAKDLDGLERAVSYNPRSREARR